MNPETLSIDNKKKSGESVQFLKGIGPQKARALAKLGYEYLRETIQNGAPEPVVEATIEILWNDVLMKEFKTSMKKRQVMYEEFFDNIETFKTWPTLESEYGDYISICRKST